MGMDEKRSGLEKVWEIAHNAGGLEIISRFPARGTAQSTWLTLSTASRRNPSSRNPCNAD